MGGHEVRSSDRLSRNVSESSTGNKRSRSQITDNTCLIMDDVDGISAGDRGGVCALNALIKKTKVCCMAHPLPFQRLLTSCHSDPNHLYR